MSKNQHFLLKIVPLLKEIVWELCSCYYFTDYVSGIRLPDFFKLAIHRKNENDVTIYRHDLIIKFFLTVFCSLVNPEIENAPVWVLPNIRRLSQVRDTKFGTNASNEMFQSGMYFFSWTSCISSRVATYNPLINV